MHQRWLRRLAPGLRGWTQSAVSEREVQQTNQGAFSKLPGSFYCAASVDLGPVFDRVETVFRRPLLAAAWLCLAAYSLPATVQTVEVTGVKFHQNVALAGSPLQLNGAGTRYKTIIKVYAVALYLPAKVNPPEDVLAAAGPSVCRW